MRAWIRELKPPALRRRCSESLFSPTGDGILIISSVNEDPYTAPSHAIPPPIPPPPLSGGIGDDAGIRLLIPVGRSGWAIAAGYLGLFSLVLIPAPISVIVSILAIRDIRRSKLTAKVKHGMGRTIFGLVMGILGTLALGAIVISAALAK